MCKRSHGRLHLANAKRSCRREMKENGVGWWVQTYLSILCFDAQEREALAFVLQLLRYIQYVPSQSPSRPDVSRIILLPLHPFFMHQTILSQKVSPASPSRRITGDSGRHGREALHRAIAGRGAVAALVRPARRQDAGGLVGGTLRHTVSHYRELL